MTITETRQRYLPAGFDEHPTTVLEALIVARAVVQEEGRWCQGAWFHNEHPEVDPENAFCNNWQACAQGIINLVTLGAGRRDYGGGDLGVWRFKDYLSEYEWGNQDAVKSSQLYADTCEALSEGIRVVEGLNYKPSIPNNNDYSSTKREDVLKWFDKAIELAQQGPFQEGAQESATEAGEAVTS